MYVEHYRLEDQEQDKNKYAEPFDSGNWLNIMFVAPVKTITAIDPETTQSKDVIIHERLGLRFLHKDALPDRLEPGARWKEIFLR